MRPFLVTIAVNGSAKHEPVLEKESVGSTHALMDVLGHLVVTILSQQGKDRKFKRRRSWAGKISGSGVERIVEEDAPSTRVGSGRGGDSFTCRWMEMFLHTTTHDVLPCVACVRSYGRARRYVSDGSLSGAEAWLYSIACIVE